MFTIPVGSTQKRFLSILTTMLCTLLIIGCDNGSNNQNHSNDSKGKLTFQLEWPQHGTDTIRTSALSDDVCVDYMIEHVQGALFNVENVQIVTDTWECNKHSGELKAPFGTGYRVVIQGLVENNRMWEGKAVDIDVIKGKPNDPIKINMAYVGEDKVAPTISQVSPADGTSGVSTETMLRVTFSEVIVGGSVDPQ